MQTKLLPLTGFRAIAVYFVFLHHWYRTIGIPASFLPYVFECHIGVTLFFVLSGYLMALRYAEFEKNLEIKKILHFYWARATRILPVFWLLTLAHFLFVYLTLRQWDRTSFFLNLLVVKGWSQSYFLSGIPQAWSMTVELTFYLLAPFLIAAVARGLGFWVWLLITSLGIFHALILWVPVPLPGEMSSFYFTALYTFLGRCFEFLFGIGIALFYRGKNFQSGNKKLAWWSYGSFIFILASPFILSLFKESSNSLGSSLGFYTIRGAAFNNLILPIAVGFFLVSLKADTWISRILGSKAMVMLGESSYVFYLIHMGFVMHGIVMLGISKNILLLILLQGISILLCEFFEKPVQLKLRSLIKNPDNE